VDEDSHGLTIRGAKMLATAGVMANELMISGIVALQPGDEPYAVTPMGAEGLKLHSRRSYEAAAGTDFDYPLAARFDENDAVVFFDDVKIPWDRVLVHRAPPHDAGAVA
jgi:4-hydroxyphenylacetate 3-monooxygenase